MKRYLTLLLGCACLSVGSLQANEEVKIGIVSFKECVERSQLGIKEQASFETMREQMTAILDQTEVELKELAEHFNDPDYMDSITPAKEEEMKVRFQQLNQELAQYQNQYYQALNTANTQLMEAMTDNINRAAKSVAAKNSLNFVLNEFTCFYYDTAMDITDEVIAEIDLIYAEEMSTTNIDG